MSGLTTFMGRVSSVTRRFTSEELILGDVTPQALSTHLPCPVGNTAETARSRVRQPKLTTQVLPRWAVLGWSRLFDFVCLGNEFESPSGLTTIWVGPLPIAIAN